MHVAGAPEASLHATEFTPHTACRTSHMQSYQRCRSLTFLEFLEAMCRMAEMMSPPPVEELQEVRPPCPDPQSI